MEPSRLIPCPDPTKTFAQQDEVVLFAMGLFGEARNQPFQAKLGVACVIRNRVRLNRKYLGGNSVMGVLLQPEQFDCFLPGNPNRSKLLNPLQFEQLSVWQECYIAANAAYSLDVEDITNGAIFYFTPPVTQPPKDWGLVELSAVFGVVSFYREARPAVAKAA